MWIPAILGLPVEDEDEGLRRWPWLTWWIAAALLIVWLASRDHLEAVIMKFGLIPADTARLGGLTFLTSFFLHAGWLHVLGNLYFLLVFGDNVEDRLGRWRYGMLVLMAALAGGLVHVLGEPRTTIPLVGASGGISAILVFYSLRFPHARLSLLFRWRWVSLPAWMAFILWALWQGAMVWLQFMGATDVSALGHLGGVAAGVALWFVWRKSC
jgi:membrane associated rhomboid family serine protease